MPRPTPPVNMPRSPIDLAAAQRGPAGMPQPPLPQPTPQQPAPQQQMAGGPQMGAQQPMGVPTRGMTPMTPPAPGAPAPGPDPAMGVGPGADMGMAGDLPPEQELEQIEAEIEFLEQRRDELKATVDEGDVDTGEAGIPFEDEFEGEAELALGEELEGDEELEWEGMTPRVRRRP